MSKPSFLLYKCRACGETFPDGHAPDGHLALAVAEGRVPMPVTWGGRSPGILTIHHECPGGDIGLSDLIGAAPDGEEGDP